MRGGRRREGERLGERRRKEEFPYQRWHGVAVAIHHLDDLVHLLHTVAPPVSIARPRQLATRARHRPTKPKSIFASRRRRNIDAAWRTAFVLASDRRRG